MCIGLQGSLGITNPGNTNTAVNQMLVNHPWLHITFTKQVLQPTLGTIRESRVLDAIRELTGLDVASIFFFWCFKIQGQDWMFPACMCLYAGPLIHWLYSCKLNQLNIGKYFQKTCIGIEQKCTDILLVSALQTVQCSCYEHIAFTLPQNNQQPAGIKVGCTQDLVMGFT